MIIPTNRLLLWVAFVVLPFSLLATAMPDTVLLSGGLIAAFIVLVLVDGLLAGSRLAGVRVHFPEVVRMAKGREGEFTVRIDNENLTIQALRLGLAFPREIYSSEPDIVAVLSPDRKTSSFSWPCKALKQGNYVLDRCYLEVPSLLGFWGMRTGSPIHTEIRVYPNLLRGATNLSALFLNRRLGIHSQRLVGKGREFELLREYLPGDSYDDVHWKATAKRRVPITKAYQVERTQEIYLIIDASRLSARSADHFTCGRVPGQERRGALITTILEQYITASLVMGLAAERQGDLFGILTFSDQVRGFVRAKSGKAHYNACRNTLYTVEAQSVTPDFRELFAFLATTVRRRALLVFLTNLDDPVLAESFCRTIELLSRRHLVVVNMLSPAEAHPLFDDPQVNTVNDLYRRLGGHLLWDRLRETEKILQRHGVRFSLLGNESLIPELISQYLSIKQRQLL